ncbi:hypothetical protein EDD85DRAFT_126609 [Armillaria nabsnona]|nr:hypothetical protein EDD85DRAFT_126609 [Armillaria nabsnona]
MQELLTFLPERPVLHPLAKYLTSTEIYTALDIVPPADRFISCQIHPDLLPNLKDFIGGIVNDLELGGVSCQPMQTLLNSMARIPLQNEDNVSEYGGLATRALEPVVQAIGAAAGLAGPIGVQHDAVDDILHSLTGGFNLVVVQQSETKTGRKSWLPIQVCSDEDKVYSVLLSEAETLSRLFVLDATKKQTGAKAMVVKLALQMATAGAEFGLFFAGYIAIAAQLASSTNPTCPGLLLLLSPVFKLQNEALPLPRGVIELTPFQANIQPEPFLAILAAMLCANLIPGRSVKRPPAAVSETLRLPILDADEAEEDNSSVGGNEENAGGDGAEPSGIPPCSIQVITNAMILRHPWLNCSDIRRISVIGHPGLRLFSNSQKNSTPLMKSPSPSPIHPRNLLRAPCIPSTTVNTVTLVERIRASRWSSIYTCRVGGDDKLFIMKLVSELHSVMVLRELYMYEVALKDCSLVPRFYGMFQRPAGGWFTFLLENVGDSLEEVYGSDWSDVKRAVSATEWEKLIDSVKKLHSLGVVHGDFEPRNVAQTTDGFKFIDFGRSEMHRCQQDECQELQDLLDV